MSGVNVRWTSLHLAFLATLLALAGCTSTAQPSAVATHTLQTASYSYSGYLAPRQVAKLAFSAADSRFVDGQRVTKGAGLTRQTRSLKERVKAKRRAIALLQERTQTASRALRSLARGSLDFEFALAATTASSDVRAVEVDIEAALLGHRRTLAQYERDLQKLRAQKPVGKAARTELARDVRQLRLDHRLAVAETVNQLRGLFESLRSTSGQLASTARKALNSLLGKAPWDGTVSIDGDTVSLQSSDYTFVYTATEEQLDLLSGQESLELQVGSARVASLTLTSTAYSATDTTSPQSPRYRVTFAVVNLASGFVPRDHGVASLSYSSTGLVVPAAFLGQDGDNYFVLRNGVRVPVQVEKDATGQFLLTSGVLRAGDVIQTVEK